ncbi:MAG: hypothetical protein GY816_16315 [Cytophagales bacterium]|nr:hypothetical protein [Cytophagales bacterium]
MGSKEKEEDMELNEEVTAANTLGARQFGTEKSARDNSAQTIWHATIQCGFVLRAVLGLEELDVSG